MKLIIYNAWDIRVHLELLVFGEVLQRAVTGHAGHSRHDVMCLCRHLLLVRHAGIQLGDEPGQRRCLLG